jgi:hypothetical protein
MDSFLLQDWIALRLGTAFSSITQDEAAWIELAPFDAAVFWITARSVVGSVVTLRLEMSPSKDEALFTEIASANLSTVLAASPAATVLKALVPNVSFARWLRWRLDISSPVDGWGGTFRVHCAANAMGVAAPPDTSTPNSPPPNLPESSP